VSRGPQRASPSFARSAAQYERARPGYAPKAVAFLVERLDLGPGRVVVDLAAGTGKLARQLMPSGARVVAVEPLAEMRSFIPAGIEVLDGTAEAIPLRDASADAVTVAQAFHWFDVEVALREIERVLRPGGLLALVSNRRDLSAFDEALARHRAHPPLEPPPVGEAFPHVHRANFAELASTESSIATLEGEAYDAAIAEFAALGSGKIRYVTFVQIGKARDLVAT
jgi:SAM-dependent methyltransferase